VLGMPEVDRNTDLSWCIIANSLSDERSKSNNPETDRLTLFDLRHCAFLWVRYALGRWTAAVAPELGDQYGFLLNKTSLACGSE